jgi:hypothetical protein
MRTALVALFAAVATTPALAQDYGGGGVVMHQAFVPYTLGNWAGGADVPAPGLMNCIGGIGYGVRDGVRTGGVGSWCGGSRARTGFGGIQGGWQSPRAGIYTAFHATLGAGWMGLDSGGHELRSTYLFARPTVSLGLPVGAVGAVELGAYGMMQVPLVDSLNGRPVDGSAFPHFGIEVAFLLGDFSRQKRHDTLRPPQDQTHFDSAPPPLGNPEPMAPPPRAPVPRTPPARTPAPIQPTPDSGDRPLAIPESDQPRTPPDQH